MRLKDRLTLALLGTPLDVVCILVMARPAAMRRWVGDDPPHPMTPEESAKEALDDGLAMASAIRRRVREKMATRERMRERSTNASPAWKAVFRQARKHDQAEWYARKRDKDTTEERDPEGVARMIAWLDSLPGEWQDILNDMKRRRGGVKPDKER